MDPIPSSNESLDIALSNAQSSDQYSFFGKRPLVIVVMNAELPLFKNREHNSESVSTIDRVITPLTVLSG